MAYSFRLEVGTIGKTMKAFLLCGSIAEKSHTLALLKYIEELLKEKGWQAALWDLKTSPLPIALPEYHQDPTLNSDKEVQRFVAAVEESDVVILGSPLYHGSYTGVIKNALDNLRGDAFHGKWAALVGNAGGSRASHVQFPHLRQVVNALVGYSAQTQIGTSKGDYQEFPDRYLLTDQEVKERCERLVNELFTIFS
ncbi:MAG: NADPH-dependent FMN reductase [Patescibacteria group bacterium]